MSLLNSREWGNFRRVTLRSPWHWPGYALSLARLIGRRALNNTRLLYRRAPHLGLKLRPEWLPTTLPVDAPRAGSALVWPRYEIPSVTHSSPLPQANLAAQNDPEAFLARHRWGDCLFATLAGGDAEVAALREVSEWLAVPPEKQHEAWETYSCCERVVNLAVFLAARPQYQAAIDSETLRHFFAESLAWIDSRLEYYGLARTNNHLLNNARAMVVAASLLGNQAALVRGLQIFARMGCELFSSAGFLRERSSHYQLVVANWLFDLLHFARHAVPMGSPAQGVLRELDALGERVAAASSCLVQWLGDSGTHIGDISPDAHPAWTLRRLQMLYPERLAGHGCEARSGGDWLLAGGGRNRLAASAFPAVFPFLYAHHGHQDLGSFVWIHDGRLMLADAGRSTYAGCEMALFQSGPAGHNTLTVDGLGPLSESLLDAGQWLPRPYATATVHMKAEADSFSVNHDGFARIPGVGAYRRSVRLVSEGLIVEDHLDGDAEVVLETYWHFPPGFVPAGETAVVGCGLRVDIDASIDTLRLLLAWKEYPFAAAYGETAAATMQIMRVTVCLPATISTVFRVTPCAA